MRARASSLPVRSPVCQCLCGRYTRSSGLAIVVIYLLVTDRSPSVQIFTFLVNHHSSFTSTKPNLAVEWPIEGLSALECPSGLEIDR